MNRAPSAAARALIARWRDRAERAPQRGSFILEAVILMTVVLVVAAGAIGLNRNVNLAQRHMRSIDVASEAAQGLLEKVDAIGWDRVAMWTGDYSTTTYVFGGTTYTAVRVGGSSRPTGVYPSGSAAYVDGITRETIEGVKVEMTMHIVWAGNCSGGCSTATVPGAFGTKRIIVHATYTPIGESTPRTQVLVFDRTALVSEADPQGLPIT